MKQISIQKILYDKVPAIRLGCISCKVHVVQEEGNIKILTQEIIRNLTAELSVENISQQPIIKSTKDAYRKLGKDPSRYRPSAEALTRRVIKGKGLYRVNNVVDLLNLVSLESGFSIGGYDADKLSGSIEFGIGHADESYHAIGRGALNIENLPIFRDSDGAFGSPTSDSSRTMVTHETSSFLMIIIDFDQHDNLPNTMKRASELLQEFAQATSIETKIITPEISG